MNIRDHLRSSRVLAVLRLTENSGDPIALAQKLVGAGITAVECTMTSPNAMQTLALLRKELDASVIVGAGTVTEIKHLAPLADAGMSFIVSPHTDPALLEQAAELGLEAIPGVMTPTDIQNARSAGASILKLFPAGPLGVDYMRVVGAPFPGIEWVPTGGIALDEAKLWLDAGALCVGIGSALWTTKNPEIAIRNLIGSDINE